MSWFSSAFWLSFEKMGVVSHRSACKPACHWINFTEEPANAAYYDAFTNQVSFERTQAPINFKSSMWVGTIPRAVLSGSGCSTDGAEIVDMSVCV